jgi:uncharacterized membrane protein
MENEYKPPRKKPTWTIFLSACIGLLILNAAVQSLLHEVNTFGWMLAAIGVALIVLAIFLATRRI